MKKKFLAFVMAFCLAAGITGQIPAYAAETAAEEEAIKTAVEKEFNTDYSITWESNAEQCWNKIILKESGIVELNFTKPENKTLGIIAMDVFVYDEKGNCFSKTRDEEKDTVEGSVYIGLDKGTYYIMFAPRYASYVHEKVSSYKFLFNANANCEKESNNRKADATAMKVDTVYTGYLGGGFSNIYDYEDEEDVYKIKLNKGQVYKFTYGNKQGSTIIKLLGKNTDFYSKWPSIEAKNFCVSPDETFIAPYTGTYYVQIYNYGNKQYKYTVKVSNVTPKTTSLTSLKAGNDAFTAKWKKSSCSGYQIQYSTSKSFKNAKTVSVSKSKVSTTIKKLSSNKKYYVRIRTYRKAGKKKAYSSWSKAKTVTTK